MFRNGGIEPFMAQSLHARHIKNVVQDAVQQAGVQYSNLAAIATTVKPGNYLL